MRSSGLGSVRNARWDPWSRSLVGFIALMLVPGLILAGLVWTASALASANGPDAPPPCQPVTATAPLQNTFPVNVLNADAPTGAAADVARELPMRDITVGTVGNDTTIRAVGGAGEVRFGPGGLDQALVVQKLLLPEAKLVQDYREGTAVDLVLGKDFTQLAPHDGPLVRRGDVVVNVYNTTYYEGVGKTTSEGLVGLGFRSGKVGLDPQNSWITDIAAVRYGPDGELGAKLVQEAVPGSTLQLDAGSKSKGVDLLIGMKWAGLAAADTLTPQEPKKPLAPLDVVRPCLK